MREPGHFGLLGGGAGDLVGVSGFAIFVFDSCLLVFFVLPVSGNTEFCTLVHVVGANLDFDGSAFRPIDRGVKRLVQVELWGRNIVFEPTRHRIPPGVNSPQGRVAVTDVADQYSDAGEVVDVRKVASANNHFLVNRVVLFGATGNIRLHFCLT